MPGRPSDKQEGAYPATKGAGAVKGGNASTSSGDQTVNISGGNNEGANIGNIDYGGVGNGEKKSKQK